MQHNLYREEILEHYKDPQNFGTLDAFDLSSQQLNPFCGDDISMFLRLKDKKVIEDISFTGKGCAISIAGASMLTDYAKGKSIAELTKFSEADMLALLKVEVSETRKKCALLALYTLKDCLGA
jgi:nitrogen fixation protein NifU and related proteins